MPNASNIFLNLGLAAMRLNWFSPLPPQLTDIGHCTARLASALMDRFDVIFWTDLRADSSALPPSANIRVFDSAHLDTRESNIELFKGVNIYNFGNDTRFHSGIYRVAQRVPGLAVLHDTKLHHFIFELSRNDTPPFTTYINLAKEIYGADGRTIAEKVVADGGHSISDYVDQMPFVEFFLENTIGVICHSKIAGEELSQRSDTPVLVLPLPFACTTNIAPQPRIWQPPWRLILFGYINDNRRLASIIRALGQMRDDFDFHFDIFGTLWDTAAVKTLIAEYGLEKRVTIHGVVSDEQLDVAIATSHLSLHLRYPTMGEASGGLLRAWAQATPTLVTNLGWYAGLPQAVVARISVENEVRDIQSALRQLAQSPLKYKHMGIAAQKWLLEAHSPEIYVERLAQALSDLPRLWCRLANRRIMLRVAADNRPINEKKLALERTARLLSRVC